MMKVVPSEEQQLLLAGYVLGDLNPAEMAVLAELLAAHPRLQQELAQLQQALELPYVTEVAPPAHLRTAILSVVAPATPVTPPPSTVIRPPRWWWGLGTVAATLIIGLSFSNYWLWQSLQALRRDRLPGETLMVTLESPDGNVSGAVNVAIDVTNLEATLQAENLPPLAAGKVYVLWTVVETNAPVTTDDKGAILTEVFTVDDQGQLSTQIAMPQVFRDRHLVKAVAITIEDAAAPQRHLSAPILIQPL